MNKINYEINIEIGCLALQNLNRIVGMLLSYCSYLTFCGIMRCASNHIRVMVVELHKGKRSTIFGFPNCAKKPLKIRPYW